MPGIRYIVMSVNCIHCSTKQRIHVVTRPKTSVPIKEQTIQCIKCDNYFDVMVPERIIHGPFPT